MSLGTKIENLQTMQNAGLPVPAFTVFPFAELVPDTSSLHAVLDDVRELPVPEQSRRLRNTVRASVRKDLPLPSAAGLYAVRSSCSLEDTAAHSFAGQFDTFLNVPAADVPARVADCVCSLFHENVLDYMRNAELDLSALEMNVLVQDMVASDVSGVLFTANPQGLLNETVIIAGRGLGDNIVSDRIDTTAYYYNMTDRVYYFDGKEDLLDRETVETLVALSEQVCALFGPRIDIEYAVRQGKVYLLQARPITTLRDGKLTILDNSNIVESYPGLTLPLTTSFVYSVYEGVFESAGRRLVKNKKTLDGLRPVFANTVASANGRMYYKISNWYEIIHCLPFHKKFMPIWQEMVGVQYKDAFSPSLRISPFLRASICVNTLHELLHAPKNMEALHEAFRETNDVVTEAFRQDMTAKEIFALYDRIETRILRNWGLTLLNDTYAFLFTGLLKERLKKKYDDGEARANRYISGIANIESLKPIRAMIALALDKTHLSETEFAERREAYIREFGDRSLEELKLESETFRTSPSLLDKKIDEYLRDAEKLQQMADNLETRLPQEKEDALTAFLRRRAAVGIGHREKSRLNRSRIFGLVREAVLRLGTLYTAQGCIDEQRDIFYLTMQELRALADAPKPMQDVVAQRKRQYAMFSLLPAYARLVFSGEPFDKNHRSINQTAVSVQTDAMTGIPCSGGVVQGEAYVVENVQQVGDVKDKILITKMTDPGWVFLLAAAKGVVSEKGSLLSHTAIVSRELGIPAVVGIEGLMHTVKTGDVVRLDGQTGTVQIVQRRAS